MKITRSLLGHQPVVVTDLDGTLLDREDYSFTAALPALAELRRRAIPVVLNSSKTAAEIRTLQRELDLDEPFIAENGGGLYRVDEAGDYRLWQGASMVREEVLERLHRLRQEYGYGFRGFADMDSSAVSAETGLTEVQADAARTRHFSEPLQWQDTAQRLEQFLQTLPALGLRAVQGGRFLTVTGECDKGASLARLLATAEAAPAPVIALGDSPNDIEMLEAADIAVIILSPHSEQLSVSGPQRVIRSSCAGPQGWNEVMQKLLAEPTLQTKGN